MPQLIDARIDADKDARIFVNWYTAPSIRATGRTRQGNPVVVYGHIPNYFSDPDNIKDVIEHNKLIEGAGVMPQNEFQRLVDLDESKDNQGNRLVFVVDYEELKNSKGKISKSKMVGKLVAKKALEKNISQVVFDPYFLFFAQKYNR